MQALFGVLFHFIGGFASGSFYIPYKKVKGWSWETYWLIGGFFSWLIVPFLAAWLTIPHFIDIIKATEGSILGLTYFFGLLWGIGGLTYGLGVRYLGVSLGSSVILGLCMILGSIIPSVYYQFFPQEGKDTIVMFFTETWGQTVLVGMLIGVLGIIWCGKAGMLKEKFLKAERSADQAIEKPEKEEFKFGIGMIVSIVSGLLSACFNFGIEAGKGMADEANRIWQTTHPDSGNFLFQNNVIYVVILLGGLSTNLIWCLYLSKKNKSYREFKEVIVRPRNVLFCALAGTTWFLQFFFYGMGESKLGNGASSWILHMAFIILIANLWGLLLKEWKGVGKKPVQFLLLGIFTIILSVVVVGLGNSFRT